MANKTKGDRISDDDLRDATGIYDDEEALLEAEAHRNRYQEDWARRQVALDSSKARAQRDRYGDNLRLQESNVPPALDDEDVAAAAAADAAADDLPSDSNAHLAKKEKEAADGTNYTGAGEEEKGKKKKSKIRLRGVITKRRAGIFGGITGSIVSIFSFAFTLVTGEFQPIRISQILHDAHFSQQESVGNGRMGRMYRFLSRGGSFGETRLGFVASKYHDKIIADLASIGITRDQGPFDFYNGFTIDTEHDSSPYKGMTPEEAAAAFEERTGFKPDIVDGKLHVNGKSFWTEPKSIKAVMKLTGHSGVTTVVRAHIEKKFGKVSRWHPLDAFINKQVVNLANYFEQKWKTIFGDRTTNPVGVDVSTATDGQDKNGNPIPATADEQAAASKSILDPKANAATLKSFIGAKTLGTADKVANFAGIVCALKALNDNVAKIRYLTVIVPLTRMGMEAIIVGEQMRSGQDVSPQEVQYLAKNFAQAAVAGAALTWYDNAQIRSAAHDTGGIDNLAKNGLKSLITQNSLGWLQWTQSLGFLCTGPAQAVSGIVSIGVGVISDGIASTVISLAESELSGPLLDKASQVLAGQAVDTTVGGPDAGPTWGGEVDEGALFGSINTTVALGGTLMTPAQSNEVTAMINQDQRSDFHAKSFYAQMFDPTDYRSLVSHLSDTTGGSPLVAINKLFSNALGASSNVLSLPFNLYSNMAHADAPTTYDYGFPTAYGFNLEDQGNPLVDNPYDNGNKAAAILDNNNQGNTPDYIQKVEDCFGVKLTKSGGEGWDAIPDKDINVYDTRNYNAADCAGPQVGSNGKVITASKIIAGTADPNKTGTMNQTATTALSDSQATDWLRIRFFVLDTSVMEGYACAQFSDATSCANDGYGNPNSAATSTTSAFPTQLAAQILADSSVTLSASAKADLQATELGQHVVPGPVSSTNPCTNPTPAILDPNLLQSIINISQEYSFTIDNLVSGHACDSGRHPLGRAADITQLNSKPVDWTGADLAADKDFANNAALIMYGLMPNGSIQNGQPVNMPGIGVCHQDDLSPPPTGVNYFVDPSCDRVVIDTGVAGAP